MKKYLLIVIGFFISLSVVGCATVSHGEYTQKWAKDKPEFLQLEDGLKLRYVRTGNGPPLVLLHTIRTQLDYFDKLVPLLSNKYQVIVLDLPGHGQSSIQDVTYSEKFFRQVTSEFITKLDLKDVTLVGESIGGVLALTTSTEIPDRVKRIVSLNPYDYGEKFGGGIRRSNSGWMVGLFDIFGSYTLEPKFVTAAVMQGGFYDPKQLPDELLTEFSRTGNRNGYRKAEYSIFRNWNSWLDARALYGKVKAPVTLVYGSSDWSNVSEREQNQKAIVNADLVTIEKSGHFSAQESPEVVAKIILTGQVN